MKFDLFDALRQMRKSFGEASEVLVRNDNCGIAVRLQVFRFGTWHHHEFILSHAELESDQISIADIKWLHSIAALKRYIENYKQPPE